RAGREARHRQTHPRRLRRTQGRRVARRRLTRGPRRHPQAIPNPRGSRRRRHRRRGMDPRERGRHMANPMTTTARRFTGWALVAPLIATVVVANVLTTTLGFVDVGFGLTATAGTSVAGAALALRDGIQDILGKRVVIGAIVAGAILSFAMSAPFIALASAVAF